MSLSSAGMPVIMDVDVISLGPEAVCLQLKYAASRKQLRDGGYTTIRYAMTTQLAHDAANLLQNMSRAAKRT